MRFTAENPRLRVRNPSYGVDIQFTDGGYETEDANEIRVLRRASSVSVTKAEVREAAAEHEIPRRSELAKDELADRVEEEVAREAEADPDKADPAW